MYIFYVLYYYFNNYYGFSQILILEKGKVSKYQTGFILKWNEAT